MKPRLLPALAGALLLAGTSFAFAQATTGGTNSTTPKMGAGAGGVGAPASGPSQNESGTMRPRHYHHHHHHHYMMRHHHHHHHMMKPMTAPGDARPMDNAPSSTPPMTNKPM